MCGLAGSFRLAGEPLDEAQVIRVRRMCDAQFHRGPDDGGIAELGPACLGSRRLAIIDLSAAGHMPMSDSTGRWWIAFNGEVYNFAQIREELERAGCTFRSHTDTEVVLQAWITWGAPALQKFIGMFAFAIYDRESRSMVLVRDRFGKKPLYYSLDNGLLSFASEIKSLLIGRGSRQIDQRAMVEWLLYRNVDGFRPRTLIDGINSVLPGQILRVTAEGIDERFYYRPELFVDPHEYERCDSASPDKLIAELDEVLNDAVRQRLVSDVPVGTLLSGGLDSSLVTSMAARYTKDLTAFHVAIAGYPNLDERRFAEELSRSLKIPFVAHELKAGDFLDALAKVVWLEDLPLTHANSVPYYIISKVARDHGVLVVQSGEGSDELFGGYGWSYRRRRVLSRFEPLFRLLPAKFRAQLALFSYMDSGLPALAHRFREQLPTAVAAIDGFARADRLLACAEVYQFVQNKTDRVLLGAMLADLGDFMAPLLRRLDRNTMGASVECRAPFLDHRVVHKAINLPVRFRVGKTEDKWIVKQVAKQYMPASLVTRKKSGFPLPVQDYIASMRTPRLFVDGFCQNYLNLSLPGIARILEAGNVWTHGAFGLVSMELWGRMYIMDQSQEQVGELLQACRR